MKNVWKMGFVLTLGLWAACVTPAAGQLHRFSTNERAIGVTTRDWAFMTAWNLSTGQLQVSPSWHNGTHTWTYTRSGYGQWVARFIYRQSAGQTRELQWSYTQVHVQSAPEGMVLIPGGTISGTNTLVDGESHSYSYPATYNITVDSFRMDKNLVTKGLWDAVRNDPATEDRGYTDLPVGGGQGIDHPVHTVSWFDAVKWLNAHSERAGLAPVYYADAAFTQVYRTGETWEPYVKSSANGFRLPTMDQWEYAARGGLESKRFPWGDEIHHGRQDLPDRANYGADSTWRTYDISPYTTWAYHPKGLETGSAPYTTPVDYFPANGYGLHDMAGNLWQWNYDWHPSFEGSRRVKRGGSWADFASLCRVATRSFDSPDYVVSLIGFRAVLPPGQQ